MVSRSLRGSSWRYAPIASQPSGALRRISERGVIASDGGGDKAHEHWLWCQGPTGQFGMKLRAHEIRVYFWSKFKHLHDWEFRMPATKEEASIIEFIDVFRINLVAVAKAFTYMR